MTVRNFIKDSYLFREGTSASTLYVICSGEVEVFKNVGDRRRLSLIHELPDTALHHKTEAVDLHAA